MFIISEIGQGWNPAALNTEEEYDFLKLGQKMIRNSDPYWIKGSTTSWIGRKFNFSDYNANDSGKVYNILHISNKVLHISLIKFFLNCEA